jgi:hypothetical protein
MVRFRKVLTFLSPQNSSRLSLATLSNTHHLLLRIPRVDASCSHKSLGLISQLSNYLRYDEQSLRLL